MARRVKTFYIQGIQWYVDMCMRDQMLENDEYNMSAREIFECVGENEVVYQYDDFFRDVELVEEPDNKYDPNAVGIYIKGNRSGFVKRNDCTEVKQLLKDPTYKYATLQIQGGDYKKVYEDEDFKLRTKKGEKDFFGILSLVFYEEEDDDLFTQEPHKQEVQEKEAIKKPEIKVKKVHLFVGIAAIAFGLIFSLLGMVGFGILEIIVGLICLVLWIKYHK